MTVEERSRSSTAGGKVSFTGSHFAVAGRLVVVFMGQV